MSTKVVSIPTSQVVVVDDERIEVVSVGTQGPPGAAGPQGPAGPSGPAYAPVGPEGAVIFKADGEPATDGSNFVYNRITKELQVNAIGSATFDGGNF